ncbi:peptidoglycan-associated lipoprotein Pal [Oceanibaculum pacificum]|uniref:Peptidoglycan-associated lipoprotein n=1 Tax=Oceanibaculum pacificum TaxID=580166 RepID=A0A154VVC8_9PROT|nr:peptidoglycan-associated lipoprotein Pal [Oceanibaculum pacificum]KZD05225.1 cell envelope biogenesis protein OmpA [Oceanibaculum pacificum]
MRTKILSVFAALLLVAACETSPDSSATASGAGSSAGSAVSSTTPAGPRAGSQEDLVVNVGDRIFFDFDSYGVRADQRGQVDKWAAWLKRNPSVRVTVEGHADERGTREYNLALGERRAGAIKDALVAQGIDASRLTTISYGKERPAVLGSNDAAWAQNRRGVLVVN